MMEELGHFIWVFPSHQQSAHNGGASFSREKTMASTATLVLFYWALSGFVCAGLFASVNESDLSQHPQKGWQTPVVRTSLYFVFGGAILPMVLLIGGAVNTAAVMASLLESRKLNSDRRLATTETTS